LSGIKFSAAVVFAAAFVVDSAVQFTASEFVDPAV